MNLFAHSKLKCCRNDPTVSQLSDTEKSALRKIQLEEFSCFLLRAAVKRSNCALCVKVWAVKKEKRVERERENKEIFCFI
jgi:hypothetical protein